MPDSPRYDPVAIQRQVAADLGREADVIVERGAYRSAGGREVSISDAVTRAIRETVFYPPGWEIELPPSRGYKTEIEVRNESTLAAARRLLSTDLNPAVLNFGSGQHPGGSYRSGSRDQEASLARSSALVACLGSVPEFYELHERHDDPLFTDAMIYSRDVPFFRGCDHQLLDAPYHLSVITAAAPRADYLEGRSDEIIDAFVRRMRRVIEIARENRHDSLVLGAWGCGASGNDPALVAELFGESIEEHAMGAFREIVFAIVDRRQIDPFERVFEPFQALREA